MAAGEFKAPFAVHRSGVLRRHALQLQRQASREGRGEQFKAAALRILQRLQTDPLTFGEPLYPLPHMRMQVRLCSVQPLTVEYAVSEEHHMVFIKSYNLLAALDE